MNPRVSVIGLGTMGQGIAIVCASAGFETHVFDANVELAKTAPGAISAKLARIGEREKRAVDETQAIAERIIVESSVAAACEGAELVIEAIVESLEPKAALFVEAARAAPPPALLASNTSGLSISALGRRSGAADRLLGLHFFNPPTAMELVEVVVGDETSRENVDRALAFVRRVGKTAVVVRDSPGFATSRLGVTLGVEAMRMVEEGVASAADIDRAMELGYRHPMGPLKVSDLVGLDVRLAILETLAKELGARFEPPAILRKLVAMGRLGKKVGLGFYRWTESGPVPEPID
jgi:3-hydroxybutyryl-CoA dehydrogenase